MRKLLRKQKPDGAAAEPATNPVTAPTTITAEPEPGAVENFVPSVFAEEPFEVAPEPVVVISHPRAKRTFESLCAKHKVRPTEAAALRRAMAVPADGLIDPDTFERFRNEFLAAPAGR